MKLWLTSAPKQGKRPNMALLRTIREIRNDMSTENHSLFASQSVLQSLLAGPQLLGVSEDRADLDAAAQALSELGCKTYIGDEPPPRDIAKRFREQHPPASAVDNDEGFNYVVCQLVMVLLAHVNGSPTLAHSAAMGQARILRTQGEDDAAELFDEAAEILLDTFAVQNEGGAA